MDKSRNNLSVPLGGLRDFFVFEYLCAFWGILCRFAAGRRPCTTAEGGCFSDGREVLVSFFLCSPGKRITSEESDYSPNQASAENRTVTAENTATIRISFQPHFSK